MPKRTYKAEDFKNMSNSEMSVVHEELMFRCEGFLKAIAETMILDTAGAITKLEEVIRKAETAKLMFAEYAHEVKV
jgi:hypothetical protein